MATATNHIYAHQEAAASGKPVYVITVTHVKRVTARQESDPTDLVEVITVTNTNTKEAGPIDPTNTNTKESGPLDPIVVITVTHTKHVNARQEAEANANPIYVVTTTDDIATTAHQEAEPTDPVYVITVTDTIATTARQEAEPTDPVYVITAADYGCPPGTCGPACRSGHYCNKLFGRVAAAEDGVSKEPPASEEPKPTKGG